MKYHVDMWKKVCLEISNNPTISGALYNIGARTPNKNPKPNNFGKFAKQHYQHIENLLNTRSSGGSGRSF